MVTKFRVSVNGAKLMHVIKACQKKVDSLAYKPLTRHNMTYHRNVCNSCDKHCDDKGRIKYSACS